MTGKPDERLNASGDLPLEFAWHWSSWVDLSTGRSYGGFGPIPLTWSDIAAWAAVRRVTLSRRDVTILRLIDSTWLTVHNEQREKDQASRKGPKSG